jgi:MoaA/NifB/PqqE/SkfB family radical SAM enzyme
MLNANPRKYQIEAHWVINLLCNYTCEYCISGAPEDPPLVGKFSAERSLDLFRSTGRTWLFHLSGGEPFLFRGFTDLCVSLAREHFLSINSNLGTNRVLDFAERVDPTRVEYVHCGVHPEERDAHGGWSLLLANMDALVKAGFPVFASCVMTPESFASFGRAAALLNDVGVPLIPKVMRGGYRGRYFPEAYSNDERAEFIRLSNLAEESVAANPHRPMRNDPTVNPLMDRDFLTGTPDFTGVMCSAGREFLTIAPDGNIYACGQRGRIGNLLLGKLHLLESDLPCRSDWCRYVCVRYSAVDQAGARLLPSTPEDPPLGSKLAQLAYTIERGAVNSFVQLSLR